MSLAKILKYSYDDYKEWEGDWELIDGYPIAMSPAPMRLHQNIGAEILYYLKKSIDSIDSNSCKECIVSYENDWKIDDFTVLRPDIIFTCNDKGTNYLTKPPKIIIEIISPSTKRVDEEIKFSLYESQGVKYYILVYPDNLIAKVYKLEDNRYILLGEFSNTKLNFEDIECDIELDFQAVFDRFRQSDDTK